MADKLGITAFDAANYLDSRADRIALLDDAFDSGERAYVMYALSAVVRSGCGMDALARDMGVKRKTLDKMLSEESDPTMKSLLRLLAQLGLKLKVVANDRKRSRTRKGA